MSYNTNLTKNKREQLKAQLDDFATFQWRGHDMFEQYGCFIINDSKGSLKFYNGPSYTNQYAKLQFSSSTGSLLGIDFQQQKIQMKVGLYWITIKEYQQFLNEINPYIINYLTFNYEQKYGYLVKMGKISDSPRHILGKNEENEYVYYTELDLTWELLGDNCVRSNLPYEYNGTLVSNNKYKWTINNQGDMTDTSLLDTPIFFELPLSFSSSWASLTLKAHHQDDEDPSGGELLFDIHLQNLTYTSSSTVQSTDTWAQYVNSYQMFLRYDSESGLIYIQQGSNTAWKLLNLQTDNNEGAYLLRSSTINKFKIPGQFSQPELDSKKWEFVLTTSGVDLTNESVDDAYKTALTIYARKNIV